MKFKGETVLKYTYSYVPKRVNKLSYKLNLDRKSKSHFFVGVKELQDKDTSGDYSIK